jgi:hypothetical protein
MRHRIIGAMQTGLGNPSPELMDNTGKVDKEMLKDAIDCFFSKWEGCDFERKETGIMMGIEPAYQYEHLKLVFLAADKKEHSFIQRGVAWGAWGSDICSTKKYYSDYKRKSKFVRFIDRWFGKV